MSNTSAIRLSITRDIRNALNTAKKLYPTLSEPEILKLGLSKIVTEYNVADKTDNINTIRALSDYSVGSDYLADDGEDIYVVNPGSKVAF